jgi:hypothetical protein
MRKNMRKSKRDIDGARELEFDNPMASPTVRLSIRVPDAAGSPRADEEGTSPSDASPSDASPSLPSPVDTPTPREPDDERVSVDEVFDLAARREGRRKTSYGVFMTLTLVLLPVYTLWFGFMAWVYYLVPNSIALVALVVSFFLPAVLYLGWTSARDVKGSTLQFYAFLLILAVSLQISLSVVMILDNGAIRNAYIQSIMIAGRDVCGTAGSLPWGAQYLPLDAICECFVTQDESDPRLVEEVAEDLEALGAVAANSTSTLPAVDAAAAVDGFGEGADELGVGIGVVVDDWSQGFAANSSSAVIPDVSMNLTLCHTVEGTNEMVCEVVDSLVDCLGFVVDTRVGLTGTHVVAICIGTLCVELLLSFLAYTMMEDLDWKEQQKALKQKGGPQTGTLRGEIVDAVGLKSGRVDTKKNSFGNRYAVLKLRSEDVAEKEHRSYSVTTSKVEDDPSPDWNQSFEGWALYESSKLLEIQVYDVIQEKRKTRDVLIGSANVAIQGDRLPDLDYTMDGNEEEGPCSINLVWTPPPKKKKDTPERASAGTINIMLQHIPVPPMLTQRSVSITKTWYFESTVLGMVFLSMVALALQSPAVPPPPDLYASLRILEIFVATHMGVELLLEMQPLLAAGKLHTCFRQTWWQLHVFVLVCNWASIMMPAVTVAENGSASDVLMSTEPDTTHKLEKLFSVGRVLRIVRPLRTLRMIKNVDMIVNVIQESLSLFGTVCLLLLFLLSILALVGMSSFGGALQYTCIGDPGDEVAPPVCSEDQLARAAELEVACPLTCPPTLTSPGAVCESYTYCALLPVPRRVGADAFGFRNYDDFVHSLVTVFVQTTGDGGMHTMPLALYDAGVGTPTRAWIMSFCTSVLMNLLALNLFLAVCCAAYSDVYTRSDELATQKQKALNLIREEKIRSESDEEKIVRVAQEAADEERQRPLNDRIADRFWVPRDQAAKEIDLGSPRPPGRSRKVSGSRCSRLRMMAKRISLSGPFEHITSAVIIGNTITMAMSKEDMDADLEQTLFTFEIVFLVCYVLEALLKFLASGWQMYIESKANRFDLFVILASLVGFIATFFADEVKALLGGSADEQMGSMQSLRAVRLLRALQVVRLLNRQKSLLTILQTIFRAWKPIVIHSLFSLFSMSMFSIIGMQLFGGSLGSADISVYDQMLPTHYETFQNGLLTTFEMTVGEDWAATMYWYMKFASEGHSYPQWVMTLFFVSMYLWMNCILFSLYVAMLLENFAVPETDKMPTQKRMFDRQQRKLMRDLANVTTSALQSTVEQDIAKGHGQAEQSSIAQQFLTLSEGMTTDQKTHRRTKSLYLFSLDHPLRLRCAKIQQSAWFSKMISSLIMFSCASLAAEGRGNSMELIAAAAEAQRASAAAGDVAGLDGFNMDPTEYVPATIFGRDLYFWINLFVLGCFAYECLLKIVIHGFILDSGPTEPYMRSKMNVLDFIIISLCMVAYLPGVPIAGSWARALRLGRIVTPLLNLTKNPDVALVLISFVRAIPDTAVVMLPLVLMAVVFSIVGVAWFGGVLKRCIDSADPLTTLTQYQNETSCMAMNELFEAQNLTQVYEWSSPPFNFDDSPTTMATLFVSLTDGTHSFMLKTAGGEGSLKGYWVAFHVVFTCFFLNLFLGVLSASFEKSSGLAVRTIGEKQWNGTQHMLHTYNSGESNEEGLRPLASAKCCGLKTPLFWFKLRTLFFKLSVDDRLEQVWRLVIAANTVTLATDMYPMNEIHYQAVTNLNTLFLALCGVEVGIKFIGFGPKSFFNDGWLVSDLCLVSFSVYYRLSGASSGVEALRVMRVFRIVVLASKIPQLVALIDVLLTCIRASFGVIMITSLVVYLYSIIGMNLFGGLPTDERLQELGIPEIQWPILRLEGGLQGVACPQCTYYTDYSNFSNFTNSFKLLMQIVFGQELEPFIRDLQFIGAELWVAFAFFASFYIATVWVCVNLLIVTVLSNFDAAQSGTIQEDEILPADLDGFAHTWAALTIGVHSAPAIKKKSENFLSRLKEELAETIEHLEGHETAPKEEPDDPEYVPEEGDPLLCGQLTVRIEEVQGLLPFRRPYCNIVAHGTTSTSVETRETRTVATNDGVASWSKTLNKGKSHESTVAGESLIFHATEFHTHLTIEVWDCHKFCNEDIGVVTLSFHDIREMLEEKTLEVDLLQRHTEQNTYRVHGNKHRWEKNELNVGRAPDDEYDPQAIAIAAVEEADREEQRARLAAEAKLAAEAEVQRLEELEEEDVVDEALQGAEESLLKSEKKKAEQRHQQAVKDARKRQKKIEKKKKKKNKKKKKAKKKKGKKNDVDADGDLVRSGLSQDASVVVEDGIAWIDPFGHCEPNGRKLKLTVEFVPGLYEVPNESFLTEHRVRFARMEPTCGVDGWLEVSEGGGAWKRRYCYMQDIPSRVLKFCRNAANISELEMLGMEKTVVTCDIPGDRIMNVVGAQGKGRKGARNRIFSIGVDEDVPNGKQVEERVGQITGVMVQAMGLKQRVFSGVRLVELVPFEEEAKIDEHEEGEDDDDGDGDGDVGVDAEAESPGDTSPRKSPRAVVDDATGGDISPRTRKSLRGFVSPRGQPAVDMNPQVSVDPTRYMAAKRAALRAEADMSSEKVGTVMKKQVIVVTKTCYVGGILRLKCEQGWCSATSTDGRTTLMIAENSPTAHYRVKKKCKIGRFVQLSNCRAEGLGYLEPGQVVEVLASEEDPETSALRHRIAPLEEGSEAWISDIDVDARATPDPYCVVEVSNQERSKDMKKINKYKQSKPDRAQTVVIDDNLTPVWEQDFSLGIVPSTRKILVHVHNDSASSIMGEAELFLASASNAAGIPGPVLQGGCLEDGQVMLGKDAIDIRVQLVVPKDKKGSGGGPAGTVVLRLAYNEIVSEAQMLETQAENDGDLVAGMLMCERKRVKYSFKASSNKQSRAWLAALRWLAEDFVRCVSPRLTIVSQLGPAPLLQSKYSTPTTDSVSALLSVAEPLAILAARCLGTLRP